ncbi:MAG TPA: DUF4192 domain-containing protein [Mycobacteriales bacterium]
MGDGLDVNSFAHRPPRPPAGAFPDLPLTACVPVGRRIRLSRALEYAETRFVARVAQDGGIRPWRRLTEARFAHARRCLTGAGRLSRVDTAALIVALADVVMRDRCWLQVESDRDPAWTVFWLYLARRALPPYRAEPLFLLAWSAWRSGDDALAGRAVEAALVEEPGHVAAAMLSTLLRFDVAPTALPALSERSALRDVG